MFMSSPAETVIYVSTYVVTIFLAQNALFSRTRWPLVSEVYEIAQAPYLSWQVIKTLFKPKSASFSVTSKNEVLMEKYVSPIYKPLLLLFILTAAGVVAAIVRWVYFPQDHNVIAIVGAWAIVNFILTSLSMKSVIEQQQRRNAPRVKTNIRAKTWLYPAGSVQSIQENADISATIIDASTSGIRLVLDIPEANSPTAKRLSSLQPGYEVFIRPEFPDAPELEHDIRAAVQYTTTDNGRPSLGLRFIIDQPVTARIAAAHLIFGNSETWLSAREQVRKGRGVVTGVCYILYKGLVAIPQVVYTLMTEPYNAAQRKKHSVQTTLPIHHFAFGGEFTPPDPNPTPMQADQIAKPKKPSRRNFFGKNIGTPNESF